MQVQGLSLSRVPQLHPVLGDQLQRRLPRSKATDLIQRAAEVLESIVPLRQGGSAVLPCLPQCELTVKDTLSTFPGHTSPSLLHPPTLFIIPCHLIWTPTLVARWELCVYVCVCVLWGSL
jgi:hypothetical protein